MKAVTVGLVGVGGYGRAYLRVLDLLEKEGQARFHAAVIRNRAKYAEDVARLESRGVLIRAGLEEMLEKDAADLGIVAIPTGIAEHHDMLVKSVEAGCDVVLEKPPTATIQEMDDMLAALKRTGRWCQVGYQSQAQSKVKELKKLICAGKLGAIRGVAVNCSEYRRDSYYARNPWAGVLKDDRGRWVLDGGVNNPFSHQVMNSLYFARPEWGKTATPVRVQAELYRAHEIESEDTAALRIETAEGPSILFFSTLSGHANRPVVIEVTGEKGTALWQTKGGVEVRWADGTTSTIADAKDDCSLALMRNAVQHKTGDAAELDCPLAMTRSVVLATDGAFLSAGRPRAIPREHLNIYDDAERRSRAIEINGIEEIIDRAFAARKLFSEMGVPWSQATRAVSVEGLKSFSL